MKQKPSPTVDCFGLLGEERRPTYSVLPATGEDLPLKHSWAPSSTSWLLGVGCFWPITQTAGGAVDETVARESAASPRTSMLRSLNAGRREPNFRVSRGRGYLFCRQTRSLARRESIPVLIPGSLLACTAVPDRLVLLPQEREEREKREAEARRKEKEKNALVVLQGEPYT